VNNGRPRAVEQTVTCNVAHSLGERAARWLLTISDQIGASAFRLRTEFLAMMLGRPEQRSAFGIRPLIDLGAIVYEDEKVTIEDRGALCDAACECYARLSDAWARLVGDGRALDGRAASFE